MSFVQHQQNYRRGRILQILAESNDQGISEPLLRNMVRQCGYKADHDTVAIDLSWLRDHGFATLREVGEIKFARITPAGRDVVSRDLDVPGIVILED